MANISQELAAIMAAVFGKDVRQSIHDAIDKINQASEMQMNAGTAIDSASSSSEGFCEGSLYINTDAYELWRCTGVNTWLSLGIFRGVDGRAIESITGPVTVGNVDTYTINFSDASEPKTFTVTNGINGTDGSTWYKSTAISGTGSGMTGFPGKASDFLINPTTGYVYQCIKTGGATSPNAAEWEYVMSLGSGGGGSVTVVDHLNSTDPYDALSANQGHNLNNKKIEKPANPQTGQMLQFDGTDWAAVDPPEGHVMRPDPSVDPSTLPTPLTPEENAVQAIIAGIADGWDNENVASLNSIGLWANNAVKTYTIQGIAGSSTPIGTTGIGTWFDGDVSEIVPSTDEEDWIPLPALVGIGSNSDIDLKLVFDPSKSSVPIVLGGYIIDDVTGKMCIRFANEISDDDTHTALIGIELTFKRTQTNPITFS